MTDERIYYTAKLAELLHTVDCTKAHASTVEESLQRQPDTCYYYVEEARPKENQLDRSFWIEKATELVELTGESPYNLFRLSFEIVELRRKLNSLKSRFKVKAVEELSRKLLKDSVF